MAGHVELFVKERRKRQRHKGAQKGRPLDSLNEARSLLEVVGYSCTIVADEGLAAYFDSEESLLPWMGDPELRIDRYDARHLLSDLSSIRKGGVNVHGPEGNEEEEELDRERYFDLENAPGTAEYLGELEEEGQKRQKVAGAGYRSVGFAYAEPAEDVQVQDTGGVPPRPPSAPAESTEKFQPPYSVPDELEDRMPASQKHHQVMLHTAKFVHTHGGQTEIILRVKQGGNPTFGFLMPEDPLHPFFRFMVDNYERLAEVMQGDKPQSGGSGVVEKDAVSLVAAAYADDESDEESENEDGVQLSGERKEEEGARTQEEGERPEAAEGVLLSAEGKRVRSGSQPERSGGMSADSGVRGALDGGLEKEAERSPGSLEALSGAAEKPDVGTEPQEGHLEQVPPSAEAAGKGAEIPSAPTVKFAIAKNPPLAAVRKVKQGATVSAEEKEQNVGPEKGGGSTLQADASVNAQDSVELAEARDANVTQPLEAAVSEPQGADVTEPPPGGANKPLAGGVKEPPLQMQRVIEKMVEFIARNGEQFEAVVRAKDEGERRFPFLAPGDSYHGYFKKLLGETLAEKGPKVSGKVDPQQRADETLQPDRSSEPDPSTAPFETLDNRSGSPIESGKEASESFEVETDAQEEPLFFGETEEATGTERFGQPAGLGSDAVRAAVLAATRKGSFGSHTELKGLEKRVRKRKLSPVISDRPEEKGAHDSAPVGLGIDAVRAAVMRATRTPSPSISANLETKGPSEAKPSGLGIDAVRAAVMKATRGKAFPDQDRFENRSVSDAQRELGPVSLPAAQNVMLSAPLADTKAGSLSGTPAASTGLTATGSGSLNSETLSERAAVEAARAAAAAAAGEADSSDALMTAPEQRRAERLKRAKMFAAMLKGGTPSAEVSRGSGSLALSGAGGSEVLGPAGVLGLSADVSGDVRAGNAATGAGNDEARGGVQDPGSGMNGGEEGELVPSEAEKEKRERPKEESETKRNKEGGRHAGTGSVDETGGEKRGRKRDGRHRDREDETRGEDREDRRRRRKERREKRAREDQADGRGAEFSGGEGSDVEREERGRQKRHRHRRRREHREARGEESPEEGEIRGEADNDGVDADEFAERGREKGREAERRRDDGEAGDATKRRSGRSRSRERRSRREPIVSQNVGGSDAKDRVEASAGRLLNGDRNVKSAGNGGKASTRLSMEKEYEEAPAVLLQEGTSGAAEGQVEVPESVRAKVRAMLGLL